MQLLWPYAVMMGVQFFCGLGLPPLPEEVVIIGAAVTTGQLELYMLPAWAACIIGILAADLVLYAIGWIFRRRLFRYQWINRFLPPDRRERIEEGFAYHGVKIMMTSRLLPGVRTGVFIMAGALHYPFMRFLIADAFFLMFGVSFFFFGGYYFYEALQNLLGGVHNVQHWVLIILIPIVAGAMAYWYFRHWRNRRPSDELDPAHLLSEAPHISSNPESQPSSSPSN